MTWAHAATTGAGAGLVYFGGLWLTVRLAVLRPRWRALLPASHLARLALVAVTFLGLTLEGPDRALAGLVGLLLARRCLVRRLGGLRHGG